MTAADDPVQWAEQLAEWLRRSEEVTTKAIESFKIRREAEQQELSAAKAANDTERVRDLNWILPSIDEEIEQSQASHAECRELRNRIQTALQEFRSDREPGPLNRDAVEATKHELKRLRRVYRQLGLELRLATGVSAKAIQFVEIVTELRFDDYLKAMWRITDGSSEQYWFTDDGDAQYGLGDIFNFLPLSEALLSRWDAGGEIVDEDEVEHQANEIQPLHIRHRLWFPVGVDYTTTGIIQFDGDPTPAGKYGQIINFVHDPDAVYLCSTSFIEFFRSSNCVLEEVLATDPDGLRERLAQQIHPLRTRLSCIIR